MFAALKQKHRDDVDEEDPYLTWSVQYVFLTTVPALKAGIQDIAEQIFPTAVTGLPKMAFADEFAWLVTAYSLLDAAGSSRSLPVWHCRARALRAVKWLVCGIVDGTYEQAKAALRAYCEREPGSPISMAQLAAGIKGFWVSLEECHTANKKRRLSTGQC